jgi:hypothetical protein
VQLQKPVEQTVEFIVVQGRHLIDVGRPIVRLAQLYLDVKTVERKSSTSRRSVDLLLQLVRYFAYCAET